MLLTSCDEDTGPAPATGKFAASGAAIVPVLSNPQQKARKVNHYLIYYGAWDDEKIRLAQSYELVICHPTQGRMTRAQVAALQAGVDPADPADDVLVLAYVSIGEDLRTANLTDEQMRADPRFVGDGTGPRVDPRGPNADGSPLAGIDPLGRPSPAGTGYASWYLDDNDVDRNGVGNGRPDRNGFFRSCFVNAGDPKWFDALQDMRLEDGQTGFREILTKTYGRGLGCDGVLLDAVDTAAPNYYTDPSSVNQSEFEWTAPGLSNFVKRLRSTYPDRVILQNRGLFFLDPSHPQFQFTTRGAIDLLLFESYRLGPCPCADNPHPQFYPDNRYNVAPKLMAEAARPDGFRVLSLGYAEGLPDRMSKNTLVGQSTLGFDSLIEDIRVTEELVGFRHYLTDAPIEIINNFVREHRVAQDTAPPFWTSTHNENLTSQGVPAPPTPRVGIQEVVAEPGALVVRWDVAHDMNRVRYTLYYQTQAFDFAGDPNLARANRAVLTPGMGRGYETGPGPRTYPYEYRLTGLEAGRTYYVLIRASDDTPAANEEKNRVFLTASPLASSGDAATLTRGPYLQRGATTSVILRWRTDVATSSRVSYGTFAGNPTSIVSSSSLTTEHAMELSGLTPNTRYYYEVGSSGSTLAGGDAQHFFVTAPASGFPLPTRVWVLGDSGTADADQRQVRDAYVTFTGNVHTNLWLMLGDNAYSSGTDLEYQGAVFAMYPSLLRQSVLWPTLGNHDAVSSDPELQTGPYFDLFTLPKNAEAGGVASQTEAYYSFDYGNIHFICLESYRSSRSPAGPMAAWLRQDLAAARGDWIVVFFHHAPYSKGSEDSDSDGHMIDMRENFVPILEEGGVDLVLAGHSHSYERSYLIDGHYGFSGSFTSAMKKDPGDGREGGNGPYRKSLGKVPHQGTVYVVAGSSGHVSSGSFGHPAMVTSLEELGSLVIDVDGNRLDVRFLRDNGIIGDAFTILKGPRGLSVQITGPTEEPTWTTTSPSVALSGTSQGATAVEWFNAATGARGTASGLSPWNAMVPLVAGQNEITVTASGPDGTATDVITVGRIQSGPLVQIPRRSVWKYHDRGQNLGTAWRAPTFDDGAWASGAGPLGYGESYITTPVSFGPDGSRKYATTYFRRSFTVGDPAAVRTLALGVMYDDGYVAYLNGSEIARASMPPGAVSFTTFSSPGHEAGNQYVSFDVSASRSLLRTGTNVLAFEVHQSSGSSSDLVFDAELSAEIGSPSDTTPPTVSVTSPSPGSTVSGPVTVNVSASDDQAVARVELLVDGTLAATDTSPPYSFTWDSRGVPDGAHTLSARAFDSANNVGTGAGVPVEVRNSGGAGPALIPARSVWKYNDRGQDLGTAWRGLSYDDSSWSAGPGVLGYGEAYTTTPVSYGPSASSKYVTTYFRRAFSVADPAQVQSLVARVMYDDGFVLYLNGTEVKRASMPGGAVSFSTMASSHEANNAYETFDLGAARSLIVAGVNVVAVEIHQSGASSSDLVFDLELLALSGGGAGSLVPTGSSWKYNDRGQDLGTPWRAAAYDDSGWAQGPGPLGYGETYLSTSVSFGPNASAKHLTTYFRKKFTVQDPASLRSLTARVMYDDGFVLYLNGVEVRRAGMPSGTVAFSTPASSHEAANAYDAFDLTGSLPLLINGENTLAVEVHQAGGSSSDLVFDLGLEAAR